MDFIKTRIRRMRRRNRIPRRIFAAVGASLLLLVLSMSLLVLPASAKNGMRMPRTEDGIVTDGDGIINSGDAMTNPIPEIGDKVSEGIDDMIPDMSSDGASQGTTPVTQAPGAGTTATPGTSDNGNGGSMTDDGVGNTLAWIIGLVVLAGVVIAIVLIIRWASGNKREH